MRKTMNKFMLTAAMAVVSVSAFAQSTKLVDLTLTNAPMKSAIEALMQQSRMKVVFESSDREFPEVTLSLTGVTAEEALGYICKAAGIYYKKDDNGVYIITRTKPEETAKVDSAPINNTKKEKESLYPIRVMHADPELVYMLLKDGVAKDPEADLKGLAKFAQQMSLPARLKAILDTTGVERPLMKGVAQPVSTENPGVRTNLESGNGISLPGEYAGQGGLGGVGGGGGIGAGGGFGGGGIGGGQGQGQGTQLGGGGLIPDSIDYIVYDPANNTIWIRATESQYQEIMDAVAQFDQVPKQVTIQVQFVTVSESIQRSLGFDWLYTRGTAIIGNVPGSFARTSDPVFLGYQTGNFQTRLRTAITDGYGRVVSSPRVRTMNNMPAYVAQGTQTNIFIPQVSGLGQGTVTTTYVPYPLNIVSQLSVRPRINNDGTVTVTIATGMQQIGQVRTSPDGVNVIPDITFQDLNIATRVRSGDTIVLAGFTSKTDQGQNQKFPILGDLPIIGQFFRSNIRDNTSSELLIFVTPTIEEDE